MTAEILSAALEMAERANETAPESRHVTFGQVEQIAERVAAQYPDVAPSLRQHIVFSQVSDFIALAQHDRSRLRTPQHTDLLPLGHPRSTRTHGLTAAALREAQVRWVSSDARVSEEAAPLLASALSAVPGSIEHTYATTRLHALPEGSFPVEALTAASMTGGNSRAARSARARMQRRDRYGRFAEMGGGIRNLIRGLDGVVRSLTGRYVGIGDPNSNDFEAELPDGRIYRVDASKSEAVKAVLPNQTGYSGRPAQAAADDPILDEADLRFYEAPFGYNKVSEADGTVTYENEDYRVTKVTNPDGTRKFSIARLTGDNTEVGEADSWAEVADKIESDLPKYDADEAAGGSQKQSQKAELPQATPTPGEQAEAKDKAHADPKKGLEDLAGDAEASRVVKKIGEKAQGYFLDGALDGESPDDFAGRLRDVADAIDAGDFEEADKKHAKALRDAADAVQAKDGADKVADIPETAKPAEENAKGKTEWSVPEGAYRVQRANEYEPQGRVDEESEDFTDDPVELAQKFKPAELAKALQHALLGSKYNPDDTNSKPNGNGYGALPFSRGDEMVPAEALVEALRQKNGKHNEIVAKLYDSALGKPVNQDIISGDARVARIPNEPKPETPEADKPLPALLDGLSDAEKEEYKATGDHTPFLPDNAPIDYSNGAEPLDPEPYKSWRDTDVKDDVFPAGFSDNPVYLAQTFDREELESNLRESINPSNPNPGYGKMDVPGKDGEPDTVTVPGEAFRDALQLQGVNTDDIIKDEIARIKPETPEATPEPAPAPAPAPAQEPVAETPETPAAPEPEASRPLIDLPEVNAEPDIWGNIDAQIAAAEEELKNASQWRDGGGRMNAAAARLARLKEIKKGLDSGLSDEQIQKVLTAKAAIDDLYRLPYRPGGMHRKIILSPAEKQREKALQQVIDDAYGNPANGAPRASTADAPAAARPERVEISAKDIQPGDIAYTDRNGFREYFVIESTRDEDGKVAVVGYYPGHVSQDTKRWNPDTPITVVRGADLPEKGDGPALSKPRRDDFLPEGQGRKGNMVRVGDEWQLRDRDAEAAYQNAQRDLQQEVAKASALFNDPTSQEGTRPDADWLAGDNPILPEPVAPKPPYLPGLPPFTGRYEEIAKEADGDWAKFKELLDAEDHYIIDFETTGIQPEDGNEPWAVAIQKISGGEVVDKQVIYMQPGRPIADTWAGKSKDGKPNAFDPDGNPLTDDFFADKPTQREAFARLAEILGENPNLIAHNIKFDNEVLARKMAEYGFPMDPAGLLDTMSLSQAVFKGSEDGPEGKALGKIAAYFGIENENWHAADNDVEVARQILDALIQRGIDGNAAPDAMDADAQRVAYDERIAKYEAALPAYEEALADYVAQLAVVKALDGEKVNLDRVEMRVADAKSAPDAPEGEGIAEAPEDPVVRTQGDDDLPIVAGERSTDPYAEEEFPPTQQQRDIVDAVLTGEDVVVRALAGTGKTSTLKLIARRLLKTEPGKRIAYIAFNKSVQMEAEASMPGNVESRTADSIAWRWAPKEITGKRGKGLQKFRDQQDFLGIPAALPDPDDPKKRMSGFQALVTVRDAINNFTISADDTISEKHFEKIGNVPPQFLDWANKWWADLNSPDGQMPINNNHVTKMWALSKPDLSKAGSGLNSKADVIFFDEAQDINPVLAKVVADQSIQKIYVGDSNQAIYGFRGAEDELDRVAAPHDLALTKSWRFGPQVAGIGNRFLKLLGSKHRIEGGGPDGEILNRGEMDDADAVLVRSNGGALGAIMDELNRGRVVGVSKAYKDDLNSLVDTAEWLQNGGDPAAKRGIKVHEDLAPYGNWDEVRAAVESEDAGRKVKMLYKIVDETGIPELRNILSRVKVASAGDGDAVALKAGDFIDGAEGDVGNGVKFNVDGDTLWFSGNTFAAKDAIKATRMFRWDAANKRWAGSFDSPDEMLGAIKRLQSEMGIAGDDKVDVVVTTAHKAKGLEWENVRIYDDFWGPRIDKDTGEVVMPSPEEMRLAYVAVTRARKRLDPGALEWVFDYTSTADEDPNAPIDATPEPSAPDMPEDPASPEAPQAPSEPDSGVQENAPEADPIFEEVNRIVSEQLNPEPDAAPQPVDISALEDLVRRMQENEAQKQANEDALRQAREGQNPEDEPLAEWEKALLDGADSPEAAPQADPAQQEALDAVAEAADAIRAINNGNEPTDGTWRGIIDRLNKAVERVDPAQAGAEIRGVADDMDNAVDQMIVDDGLPEDATFFQRLADAADGLRKAARGLRRQRARAPKREAQPANNLVKPEGGGDPALRQQVEDELRRLNEDAPAAPAPAEPAPAAPANPKRRLLRIGRENRNFWAKKGDNSINADDPVYNRPVGGQFADANNIPIAYGDRVVHNNPKMAAKYGEGRVIARDDVVIRDGKAYRDYVVVQWDGEMRPRIYSARMLKVQDQDLDWRKIIDPNEVEGGPQLPELPAGFDFDAERKGDKPKGTIGQKKLLRGDERNRNNLPADQNDELGRFERGEVEGQIADRNGVPLRVGDEVEHVGKIGDKAGLKNGRVVGKQMLVVDGVNRGYYVVVDWGNGKRLKAWSPKMLAAKNVTTDRPLNDPNAPKLPSVDNGGGAAPAAPKAPASQAPAAPAAPAPQAAPAPEPVAPADPAPKALDRKGSVLKVGDKVVHNNADKAAKFGEGRVVRFSTDKDGKIDAHVRFADGSLRKFKADRMVKQDVAPAASAQPRPAGDYRRELEELDVLVGRSGFTTEVGNILNNGGDLADIAPRDRALLHQHLPHLMEKYKGDGIKSRTLAMLEFDLARVHIEQNPLPTSLGVGEEIQDFNIGDLTDLVNRAQRGNRKLAGVKMDVKDGNGLPTDWEIETLKMGAIGYTFFMRHKPTGQTFIVKQEKNEDKAAQEVMGAAVNRGLGIPGATYAELHRNDKKTSIQTFAGASEPFNKKPKNAADSHNKDFTKMRLQNGVAWTLMDAVVHNHDRHENNFLYGEIDYGSGIVISNPLPIDMAKPWDSFDTSSKSLGSPSNNDANWHNRRKMKQIGDDAAVQLAEMSLQQMIQFLERFMTDHKDGDELRRMAQTLIERAQSGILDRRGLLRILGLR